MLIKPASDYKHIDKIYSKLLLLQNTFNSKSKKTINSYKNKIQKLELELNSLKEKLQNGCEHLIQDQIVSYHWYESEDPNCEGPQSYWVRCGNCDKQLDNWVQK